jgi:hypothetical protein
MAKTRFRASLPVFGAGCLTGVLLVLFFAKLPVVTAATMQAPGRPAISEPIQAGPGKGQLGTDLRLDILDKAINDRSKALDVRVAALEEKAQTLQSKMAALEGGVVVSNAGVVTIRGSLIKLQGGMLDVAAGMSKVSGVVAADTLQAKSVISSSYTNGAGNIW